MHYDAAVRLWLVMLVACAGCDIVFSTDEVDQPPAEVCGDPKNVPATIHLTGTLFDAEANTPIAMASVDATPGGVATTDRDGIFAIDVSTGQQALHLKLVVTGVLFYPTHEIYYQRPFGTSPADVSNKLLSTSLLNQLYAGTQRDAANGTILVSLRGCDDNGVADATVEVEPQSPILYQGGGMKTNGTGVAYALNVPQGAATIRAGLADPFPITVSAGSVALVFVVQP